MRPCSTSVRQAGEPVALTTVIIVLHGDFRLDAIVFRCVYIFFLGLLTECSQNGELMRGAVP